MVSLSCCGVSTGDLMDLQVLRQWIGRTERQTDEITATSVAAMAAALNREEPIPLLGFDVPALWHWMLFRPLSRNDDLGTDGHPNRGGFIPPVPLARRMWAGGRLEFHHPLQVGEEVTRVSRIADISVKEGRTGLLVFVTVRHEVSNARGIALTEDQSIVFRDKPLADAPVSPTQRAGADAEFSREVRPDAVLLFRYSALTFNAHRIHYDRDYATKIESYPGLVVHGPLIATLLMDLLREQRRGAQVRRFAFKSVGPLHDTSPFRLCGKREPAGGVALWACNPAGDLAMTASADFA